MFSAVRELSEAKRDFIKYVHTTKGEKKNLFAGQQCRFGRTRNTRTLQNEFMNF